MSSTFVPRAPSILKRPSSEPRATFVAPVKPARNFQVLQSSRAPAQLCLFQRSGAIDVK